MSREFYESYGLDYELTIQSKIGGPPQVINLLVIELNQYEDMYGPFMRMEVVINDSMGLLDKLPIVGDETLTFKYGNPNEKKFTAEYVVYKVSGRQGVKDRNHVYTLHAISKIGHKNSLEYIYKPFIEKMPHEIVQDVYKNYLQGDKQLVIWPGINKITRVASGQNPLQFINQIAKESQSPPTGGGAGYESTSSFVFFESIDYVIYMPLYILFQPNTLPRDPYYEFYLSVPKEEEQMVDGKGAFPARSISNIKFLDSFDNLDQAHRGAYYNEVNVIDPILKRFKVHPLKNGDKKKFQFDYKKNWDQIFHIDNSGKKFISEQGELGKAKKAYSTHRRLLLSQIEEDNETYPVDSSAYFKEMQPIKTGDQLNAPRKRDAFLAKSAHERTNMATNVIEITTPGIAEIYIGNLVKIKIPQPTQLEGETSKFLFLYGQEATFIVTAIRHNYNTAQDTYTTVLSCSKESFGKDPAPMGFDNSPES